MRGRSVEGGGGGLEKLLGTKGGLGKNGAPGTRNPSLTLPRADYSA